MAPTTRHVTVTTPLAQELLLRRMHGREELGQPFVYELELLSDNHDIQATDLLGKHVTVHLETVNKQLRHFDGLVTQFAYVGARGRYAAYRTTLRPWLWMLTQSITNAVFQDCSVPDLVRERLAQSGYGNLGPSSLKGTYDKRELVVQYQESLFNFVSRWLEHEGIYYHFEHEDGSHKLSLADDSTSGSSVPHYETLSYRAPTVAGREHIDHFYEWHEFANVIPEAYVVDSYNFQTPKVDLAERADDPDAIEDYRTVMQAPATHLTPEAGRRYAKLYAEEHKASQLVFEGSGNVRGLYPGALFTLKDHPRKSYNREYCVIHTEYEIDAGDFESLGGGGGAPQIHTRVRAIASDVSFRPARRTPRPVAGTESALVVGTQGSEISTEKYARIRVQFHWDSLHKRDEDSSCWIRVAQPWAGSDYGVQFIPRVGHEVLVDFLNGNPDEPIVIGSVYNEDNQPPFALSKQRTRSGIRTRSSKDGSKDAYNQLSFDDDKGHEEVYLQAQRDLRVKTKHNSTSHVGHDAAHTVENNLTVKVAEGDYDTFVNQGAMRAEVKDSLYGVTAKEVAVSATEAITLRVGEVSIRIDGTSIALTVDKNAEIKLDLANLLIFGTTVNINPPGTQPTGAAKLPDLLTRMCQPPPDESA